MRVQGRSDRNMKTPWAINLECENPWAIGPEYEDPGATAATIGSLAATEPAAWDLRLACSCQPGGFVGQARTPRAMSWRHVRDRGCPRLGRFPWPRMAAIRRRSWRESPALIVAA